MCTYDVANDLRIMNSKTKVIWLERFRLRDWIPNRLATFWFVNARAIV